MSVDYRLLLASAMALSVIAQAAAGGGGGGGSSGGGGGEDYYQYANVPAHGKYEYGYKRGNPTHIQERHEKLDGPHFKTKVKWADDQGNHGEHLYDYNHADKSHHDKGHGGGGGHGHGHGHH